MYDRLKITPGEFRLLFLEAGQGDDPLICSLSVESLISGSFPAYETISYHWGGLSADTRHEAGHWEEDPDKYNVAILGHSIAIPFRAAQALQCMRLWDKPRVIWIDSVCIDQGNVQEREEQIAVMGEIYKRGTRNLIHLGAGDKEEALAGVTALRSGYERLNEQLARLHPNVQKAWREQRIKPDGWGKLEGPPILLDDPWPVQVMFRCAWFT